MTRDLDLVRRILLTAEKAVGDASLSVVRDVCVSLVKARLGI